MNKTLNEKIWQGKTLRPEVEKALKKITDKFINDYCDVPLDVIDIQLVGSNASYNYSEYSDLDTHIIVNNDLTDETLATLLWLETKNFNTNYDITIHGVEVELYIDSANSQLKSNGIYSLKNGKWLKFPIKLKEPDVDITDDVNTWKYKIENALASDSYDIVKQLLDKIYIMRKNSIKYDGEFGVGNLIFKAVRNLGLVDAMKQKLVDLSSKELTLEMIEDYYENGNKKIKLDEAWSSKRLVTKSLNSQKGKIRFNKRKRSSIDLYKTNMKTLDFDAMLKRNRITIPFVVHGETNDYTTTVQINRANEYIKKAVEGNDMQPDVHLIYNSLCDCVENGDLRIFCSCPDYQFRFHYWSTKRGYNYGDPQYSNGKRIRNPNDTLGSSCKHCLLVLDDSSWIYRLAYAIYDYLTK